MHKADKPMENTKNLKISWICFVAGKSGGHILPCITLAQQIIQKHPAYRAAFFSTTSLLDSQLLRTSAIVSQHIPLAMTTFSRKTWYNFPKFVFQFIIAFITSIYHLRKLKPEAVLSTGSFVSVPVCLAAAVLRIPIELYELNAIPGRAIKILAPFAQKICVCFEESLKYLPAHKCKLTSYPIKFSKPISVIDKSEVFNSLNLTQTRKTILILGGSQGSLFINAALRQMLEKSQSLYGDIQIIHQTGALDSTDWKAYYESLNIPAHVFSYNNALEQLYAVADVVICRAGAGTLAEISFFNKKCVTIPLETRSNDHQVNNAAAACHMRPELFKIVRQKELEYSIRPLIDAVTTHLQTQ